MCRRRNGAPWPKIQRTASRFLEQVVRSIYCVCLFGFFFFWGGGSVQAHTKNLPLKMTTFRVTRVSDRVLPVEQLSEGAPMASKAVMKLDEMK